MKILYITALPLEVNNSSQLRNIGLIKGFIQNKCDVTVLCSKVNSLTNIKYLDSLPYELKDVKIIRLGIPSIISNVASTKNGIIIKLIKYLKKWYRKFSLYKAAGLLIKNSKSININLEDFDLIISSSDPKASHKIAENIIKKAGINIKWLQYWGDPLLGDITDKTNLPKWYKKLIEHSFLKKADFIVYVSPFTYKAQQSLYSDSKNKMFSIPPPFLKERIYDKNSDIKNLTFGYFGSYNKIARNINPLINSISKYKNHKFIIAGDSDLNLKSSNNITIHPRLNHEEIEILESKCDILICILNKSGSQIPGKVYQYAATNKPIILLLDGDNQNEMKKYFSDFNRFILCINEENSIYDIISTLPEINLDFQSCKQFSPYRIANQILNIVESNK